MQEAGSKLDESALRSLNERNASQDSGGKSNSIQKSTGTKEVVVASVVHDQDTRTAYNKHKVLALEAMQQNYYDSGSNGSGAGGGGYGGQGQPVANVDLIQQQFGNMNVSSNPNSATHAGVPYTAQADGGQGDGRVDKSRMLSNVTQ